MDWKPEHREESIGGAPCIKVLKRSSEPFIAEQLGANYLANRTAQTELRKVKQEIAELKKIKELQARKDEIEKSGVTLL